MPADQVIATTRRRRVASSTTIGSVEGAVLLFFLALALGLRVGYYLINPSFSVDESALALNLLHRPYADLLHQLNFNQAAPLGFLMVQKLAISALGSSDYVLRFLPLASALASALLFYFVASKVLNRRAALLALSFFAVSQPLLFYSATAKQYSIDVFLALTLYAVVFSVSDRLGNREAVALALAGGAAIWFSHPAIFILAATGSVLAIEGLVARRWACVLRLLIVGALWLGSFVGFYILTRPSLAHLERSIAQDPAAILTAGGASGRLSTYGGTVRELLGIPHFGFVVRNGLVLLGVSLCVVGFAALVLRRRSSALLLVVPAVYAVIASAVGKYPLYSRTLLFLVPGLLILAANGAQTLYANLRPRVRTLAASIAMVAFFLAIAWAPANHLRIRDGGEFKQAMHYVAHHQRLGDSLYVYPRAQYDFRYYLECKCFSDGATVRRARLLWPLRPALGSPAQWAPTLKSDPPRLVIGSSTGANASGYRRDLASLDGRSRVWILLAATPQKSRIALLMYLDHIGTKEDAFETRNDVASAYLYDLSQ